MKTRTKTKRATRSRIKPFDAIGEFWELVGRGVDDLQRLHRTGKELRLFRAAAELANLVRHYVALYDPDGAEQMW